jgi:hypothetical protein
MPERCRRTPGLSHAPEVTPVHPLDEERELGELERSRGLVRRRDAPLADEHAHPPAPNLLVPRHPHRAVRRRGREQTGKEAGRAGPVGRARRGRRARMTARRSP